MTWGIKLHTRQTKLIQMYFRGNVSWTEKLKNLKFGNITRLKTQTNWESKEQTDSFIKINWCWEYSSMSFTEADGFLHSANTKNGNANTTTLLGVICLTYPEGL